MHKPSLSLLLLASTLPLFAQGPAAGADPAVLRRLLERHLPQMTAPFEFAAIGDQQYGATGERLWPFLQRDINQSGVSFVVHAGDVKSGDTVCSNEMFANRVASFNAFNMPMILTPGDNEWTDCHRENNGSFDSIERLNYLRRVFYPTNESFGRRRLSLSLQSEDPRYATYRENSMWSQGNVLFATVHIVGSNNNLGRNAANDAEFVERTNANFNWLRTIFSVARDNNFSAVVLTMQANPGFNGTRIRVSQMPTGFRDSFFVFEEEAIVYDRPILLIIGDSHIYRMDKPLLGARSGRALENVQRLEVPGSADVHWIRVRVNPAKPHSPFSFEHEDVVEARPAQQRP
jgi:hypothetical protein